MGRGGLLLLIAIALVERTSGHGAIVSPRGRNSIDYRGGVNTQSVRPPPVLLLLLAPLPPNASRCCGRHCSAERTAAAAPPAQALLH